MQRKLLTAGLSLLLAISTNAYTPTPPPFSPATSLPNRLYTWRSQQVRYQVSGPADAPHAAVLVHGLFVNADHWRKTLKGLADDGSYRVYAIDLLGSGWSSKPPRDSDVAKELNGERGRFLEDTHEEERGWGRVPSILSNVALGTASGGSKTADVDLRHPLGSPYNFFTWSEQLADFTRDVVLKEGASSNKVSLVCNSIGTMSSLQAVLDNPDLYDGVCVINPNYRELHSAEVPLPNFSMPVVRQIQRLLRENGRGLYDALAKKDTVREILKEPYAVIEAVDDELVSVLLDPLLTEGAADVVFDTLSYSAGPLPEQQLSSPHFPAKTAPVWVMYGRSDPWTPGARVESMMKYESVEKVIPLDGVGHCPHDEAPEVVNPIILEFLQRVKNI